MENKQHQKQNLYYHTAIWERKEGEGGGGVGLGSTEGGGGGYDLY